MGNLLVKTALYVIFACVLLIVAPAYAEEKGTVQSEYLKSLQNSSLSSQEYQLNENPDVIYEIKFISPQILDNLLKNRNPKDVILKSQPGSVIGVATGNTLYIRADMQSDEFLLKNRNVTDLKDDIIQHLIDISFGKDTSHLLTLGSDRKHIIWFDSGYTSEDIDNSLKFVNMFNNLSATAQFENEWVMKGTLKNNYESIPYYYYNIKIVPKQFLDDYKKNAYKSTNEEILYDGNKGMIGFLSKKGSVILWDGLEPKDRDYYISKSLLWYIGLHGESTKYSDSFFSQPVNKSSTLSIMDQEAIKLLYGGRLIPNMTAEEVRKALYIT